MLTVARRAPNPKVEVQILAPMPFCGSGGMVTQGIANPYHAGSNPVYHSKGEEVMLDKVLEFATAAHGDQKRKYTGDPYINHPIAVAEIVKTVPHTDEMIAAALLHDVVEDTHVTIDQIANKFGDKVAELVGWLTDISRPEDGNRAFRKSIDRDHSADAPAEAQTIKLADLIHNSISIAEHDPNFWKVYKEEKIELLKVLTKGDKSLMVRAQQQIGGS